MRIHHIIVFEESKAVVSPASRLPSATTTATRMHPESRSASTRRTSPALNPPPANCGPFFLSLYFQNMIQSDGYLVLEVAFVRVMRACTRTSTNASSKGLLTYKTNYQSCRCPRKFRSLRIRPHFPENYCPPSLSPLPPLPRRPPPRSRACRSSASTHFPPPLQQPLHRCRGHIKKLTLNKNKR
jgi:hypothetical protein